MPIIEKVIQMVKVKGINRDDLSRVNSESFTTMGILKKGRSKKYTRNYRRVGGIRVGLLRKFLKYLKDDNIIGVYLDKQNDLTPLHCKRRLLCCMRNGDKEMRAKQEEDEFEEKVTNKNEKE